MVCYVKLERKVGFTIKYAFGGLQKNISCYNARFAARTPIAFLNIKKKNTLPTKKRLPERIKRKWSK